MRYYVVYEGYSNNFYSFSCFENELDDFLQAFDVIPDNACVRMF